MSGGSVIVVGGGLAGITAALELSQRGSDVCLLEARPRLGGATYSFSRGPLTVDTGQHVFLRSYQHYRALLEKLGVSHLVSLQRRLDIPVLSPERPPARLRRAPRGPAPLHLLPALARYDLLSAAERLSAVRCANALKHIDPDDPAADAVTFGAWLHRHGQGPRSVTRLWGLLTIAALNIDPEQASLALAARVFRNGLLDRVDASDIGIADVPLESLHDRATRTVCARRGIRLHTGERVRAIGRNEHGLTVRTDAGELTAGGVVVAVPHREAAKLVPPAATAAPRRWSELGDCPIVNVHLRYDRPVTRWPFAAVLGPETAWIFDRTRAAGINEGQYLVCSISAADAQLLQPAEQILRRQEAALAHVFPALGRARLLDSFVSREPRATFRQQAGSGRFRPPAETKWPDLALAGAWTATGWPDTMEGAVRSGLTAADVLCPSDNLSLAGRK